MVCPWSVLVPAKHSLHEYWQQHFTTHHTIIDISDIVYTIYNRYIVFNISDILYAIYQIYNALHIRFIIHYVLDIINIIYNIHYL